MQLKFPANAATTPKMRAYIQKSTQLVAVLARELGANETTIHRWKRRATTLDRSHTPNKLAISLTKVEQGLVVGLRTVLALTVFAVIAALGAAVASFAIHSTSSRGWQAYNSSLIDVGKRTVVARRTADGEQGLLVAADNNLRRLGFNLPDRDLTIRLKTPNGYEYRPGDAENVVVLGPTAASELLIYSGNAKEIRLTNVTITDCRDVVCPSDAKLIREVQERTGISPTDKPTLERGIKLLDWVVRNSLVTCSREIVARSSVGTLSAAETLYLQYRTYSAAGFCGSVALFNAKVLRLFGYDAFTVDFGELPVTHVTTIVRLGDGKFHMLDPMFNAHLETASGQPLDLVTALSLRPEDVRTIEHPTERGVLVSSLSEPMCSMMSEQRSCQPIHNRWQLCRTRYTIANYLAMFRDEWRKIGLDPDRHSIVDLLRKGVFSETSREGAFMHALRPFGVPLHKSS